MSACVETNIQDCDEHVLVLPDDAALANSQTIETADTQTGILCGLILRTACGFSNNNDDCGGGGCPR